MNEILYQRVIEFSLEGSIPTILFGLPHAIQIIVDHDKNEENSKSRSFENVIRFARKNGKTYCACLTELALT